MSRPLKEGLDYFTLDCHSDGKMRLIEAEFGLRGFAIVVKLLQKIYGELGYYCEWNEEVALLFARENGVGGNAVSQTVEAALRRGIFDYQMHERYSILTSADIQERYLHATKRRSQNLIEDRYLLLSSPKNELLHTKTPVNETKTVVFVDDNPQSKVKESKVIYSAHARKSTNRFNNFHQRAMDNMEELENSLITTN